MAALVGVLSFSAGDTGLPYAVDPTSAELSELGNRLAHDLRAAGTPAAHIGATCADADCARRAGAAHHLTRVIFSSATRHMAMIWTAQCSIVDVRTGRVSGPFDVGYKGDYDAIRVGLDSLADAMHPVLARSSAAVAGSAH